MNLNNLKVVCDIVEERRVYTRQIAILIRSLALWLEWELNIDLTAESRLDSTVEN